MFKLVPGELEIEIQERIARETIVAAASGFGQDPNSEAFVDDVRRHVLGAPELFLVYEKEACIAFAALANLTIEKVRVLYLGGLIVERTYQGRGLMRKIISHEISQSNPEVLAARTQNPCILDLLRPVCRPGEFYPYDGIPSGECRLVLPGLTRQLGMNSLDSKTLIDRGTYGCCLYGSGVPQSRHEESNRFFSQIDSQKGDSILFIGRAR